MRSTATELGTPRISVSSVQIEGVDALEPGVPGRFGQLGPHRGRDLCPQVICRWSAHGADSPELSTGVSTRVEKHRSDDAVGHDPCLAEWPGKCPARRGRLGAPGSADLPAPRTRNKRAGDRRRTHVHADGRGTGSRPPGWIAAGRRRRPYTASSTPHASRPVIARVSIAVRAPRPRAPHLGPGVRGGHA